MAASMVQAVPGKLFIHKGTEQWTQNLRYRNGHHFWEQTKFRERTTFFLNDGVVQKKTNFGRTSWIVKRDKKYRFLNE